MPEIVELSKREFSIAYAGAERKDDHSIRVETLAPALLAFGKLMREANAEANGKRAKANVYVVSDFEHKCFNVNFELIVGIYTYVKTLVQLEEVKDAKEILEWIGIISTPIGAGTFLGYLQWKNGRKIVGAKEIRDENGEGAVIVQVEGDNNPIAINQNTYNLSLNPHALRATRDAFLPVGHDGFDKVEVRQGDAVTTTITPHEIAAIVASCATGIAETKVVKPDTSTTTAWLSVYSPVYDEEAKNWRFRYGPYIIYADISETTIAHDALERGGSLTDDSYQVSLEIIVEVNEKGERTEPRYKILEVLNFTPAPPRPRQSELFPRKHE